MFKCSSCLRAALGVTRAGYSPTSSEEVPWQRVQGGVYDCRWGTDTVRVIVAGELPREAHNAPLHLFSASPDLVTFGRSAYRRHSANTSSLLEQLFERLRGEGFAMWTMEDFQRQYAKEHFARLTPEEQREALELLPPEKREEVIRSLPLEERLAGLLPEERLAGLPPEQRLAGLPPEQRLAGLSSEQIEQLRQHLDRLVAGRSGAPRKPRRKK